jgi:hypothetical protein
MLKPDCTAKQYAEAMKGGKFCPECDEEKSGPWYDDHTGLWVHTQKRSGMIVICNRLNPDPDDSGD